MYLTEQLQAYIKKWAFDSDGLNEQTKRSFLSLLKNVDQRTVTVNDIKEVLNLINADSDIKQKHVFFSLLLFALDSIEQTDTNKQELRGIYEGCEQKELVISGDVVLEILIYATLHSFDLFSSLKVSKRILDQFNLVNLAIKTIKSQKLGRGVAKEVTGGSLTRFTLFFQPGSLFFIHTLRTFFFCSSKEDKDSFCSYLTSFFKSLDRLLDLSNQTHKHTFAVVIGADISLDSQQDSQKLDDSFAKLLIEFQESISTLKSKLSNSQELGFSSTLKSKQLTLWKACIINACSDKRSWNLWKASISQACSNESIEEFLMASMIKDCLVNHIRDFLLASISIGCSYRHIQDFLLVSTSIGSSYIHIRGFLLDEKARVNGSVDRRLLFSDNWKSWIKFMEAIAEERFLDSSFHSYCEKAMKFLYSDKCFGWHNKDLIQQILGYAQLSQSRIKQAAQEEVALQVAKPTETKKPQEPYSAVKNLIETDLADVTFSVSSISSGSLDVVRQFPLNFCIDGTRFLDRVADKVRLLDECFVDFDHQTFDRRFHQRFKALLYGNDSLSKDKPLKIETTLINDMTLKGVLTLGKCYFKEHAVFCQLISSVQRLEAFFARLDDDHDLCSVSQDVLALIDVKDVPFERLHFLKLKGQTISLNSLELVPYLKGSQLPLDNQAISACIIQQRFDSNENEPFNGVLFNEEILSLFLSQQTTSKGFKRCLESFGNIVQTMYVSDHKDYTQSVSELFGQQLVRLIQDEALTLADHVGMCHEAVKYLKAVKDESLIPLTSFYGNYADDTQLKWLISLWKNVTGKSLILLINLFIKSLENSKVLFLQRFLKGLLDELIKDKKTELTKVQRMERYLCIIHHLEQEENRSITSELKAYISSMAVAVIKENQQLNRDTRDQRDAWMTELETGVRKTPSKELDKISSFLQSAFNIPRLQEAILNGGDVSLQIYTDYSLLKISVGSRVVVYSLSGQDVFYQQNYVMLSGRDPFILEDQGNFSKISCENTYHPKSASKKEYTPRVYWFLHMLLTKHSREEDCVYCVGDWTVFISKKDEKIQKVICVDQSKQMSFFISEALDIHHRGDVFLIQGLSFYRGPLGSQTVKGAIICYGTLNVF
ncbi:MAG: hypothetical protein VW378_03340 [bacterium]